MMVRGGCEKGEQMKSIGRRFAVLLLSALIAVILPAGYFLIDFFILRAPLADARQSFLIGFGLFFVVTLVQMIRMAMKKD